MKIIDRIIIDNKAPKNKNVIWIDTSKSEPVQRYYWNGEWKPLGSSLSGDIDATPMEGSTNPVQSGGVFTALANLIADGCLYGGIVNPYSEPSEDKRFFYISETEGVYTHFDNLELNGKNLFIIHWDNYFETWAIDSFGESHEGVEQDIAQRFNLLYLDLGFDRFSPLISYSPYDYVTNIEIGGLWRFNTNHQGVWDENDVDSVTLVDFIDDLLNGKQDTISDLSTIRSGAAAGATAVQPSDLATVATSGSYNDLLNKPTIPAAQVNSDWNANSGVAQILNKPTIPDVSGKADKVVGATSGDVATLDSTGNLTDSGLSVFDFFVMVEDASTPPASMAPNTVYKYGTLNGNTTFPALATPTEPDIANVYCWTFTTPATAPTITWPSAITSWAGGSAPTIAASKSYEVSVMDGIATIIEN